MPVEVSILIILIFGLVIRIYERSWVTPSSIFSLVWMFITVFSVLSASDYYFSISAMLFIGLSVFSFFTGGMMAGNSAVKKFIPQLVTSSKIFRGFFIVSVVSGFLSILFLLRDGGFSFSRIFAEHTLSQMAVNFSRDRYSGVRLSSFTMLTLSVAYSGCMCGAILMLNVKGFRRLCGFIPFISILIFTFLYTARSVFLYGAVLTLGTLLAAIAFKKNGGEVVLFNKRNSLFILFLLFAVPSLFAITQAMRLGITKLNLTTFSQMLVKTKVWFSGNVSAYSIWYDQIRNSDYSFGRYTLGGISEWLGFSYREVGVYTNSFDVNGKMSFSNIYTLFRFLIDDFGDGGCLIILFLLGFICKKLYSQCINGNLVSVSILSGIYALILFSFIASAWAYNSVLMAWFVFVFLIFITQRSNYDRQ